MPRRKVDTGRRYTPFCSVAGLPPAARERWRTLEHSDVYGAYSRSALKRNTPTKCSCAQCGYQSNKSGVMVHFRVNSLCRDARMDALVRDHQLIALFDAYGAQTGGRDNPHTLKHFDWLWTTQPRIQHRRKYYVHRIVRELIVGAHDAPVQFDVKALIQRVSEDQVLWDAIVVADRLHVGQAKLLALAEGAC